MDLSLWNCHNVDSFEASPWPAWRTQLELQSYSYIYIAVEQIPLQIIIPCPFQIPFPVDCLHDSLSIFITGVCCHDPSQKKTYRSPKVAPTFPKTNTISAQTAFSPHSSKTWVLLLNVPAMLDPGSLLFLRCIV